MPEMYGLGKREAKPRHAAIYETVNCFTQAGKHFID